MKNKFDYGDHKTANKSHSTFSLFLMDFLGRSSSSFSASASPFAMFMLNVENSNHKTVSEDPNKFHNSYKHTH